MLNKLTQKKSVLGERAVDAARQHAHIDTNRTYNMTTRDRTHSSRADPYAHSEQARIMRTPQCDGAESQQWVVHNGVQAAIGSMPLSCLTTWQDRRCGAGRSAAHLGGAFEDAMRFLIGDCGGSYRTASRRLRRSR